MGGREYYCALHNCRDNFIESVGYAVRSATARRFRLFVDNVAVVIALNQFAKDRLVKAGFAEDRTVVLPNMVDIPATPGDASSGQYAVFSGRMCPEKGVATLVRAARRAQEIPIRLLGDGPTRDEHESEAPQNAKFLGQLPAYEVAAEYRSARFVVVPSVWFEGCPLVILEAMSHGLPVIASRIGGLPELVDDGVTGLLFAPGNEEELANAMRILWRDPELCKRMGAAGRERAIRRHGEGAFWQDLKSIYETAIQLNREDRRAPRPR
jgi:glycosyltransferase involved in cell wall biosynthesis